MISPVVTATMGLEDMALPVRVALVQLVLHIQMMRMMMDRMMTMTRSEHKCYIQLAAPLCLDCLFQIVCGDR
jgi:hypothetical protein